MKQAFLKFSGKKFLSVSLFSAALFFTTVNANSTGRSPNIEILSRDNTSLQFVSNTGQAFMVKMHVRNEKGDKFKLTITNADGDELFTGSYSDTSFQKRITVLTGNEGGKRYYFTISSKNKDLKETYVVSTATRTVNDVEITKL